MVERAHEGIAISNSPWWGSFALPVSQAGCWRIGPLTLWIQRLAGEWRVAYERATDHLDPVVRLEIPVDPPDLLAQDTVMRFALAGDDPALHLVPMLADRPVVTRPQRPFMVLPTERTTLFISTPVWVRLEIGSARVHLIDLPIVRPSDTWFGTSTREGELCYASRTFCYQRLEELPRRPHRVTSAVTLHNQSEVSMPLERLKLPTGQLSVYHGADGHLWTEDIVVKRIEGKDVAQKDVAELEVQDQVTKEARKHTQRLSPPREAVASGRGLVRVWGSLFS